MTSIEIFTIDSIDTIRMEVGLTFAIKIQWMDPRLKYSNVLNAPFDQEKTVKVLGRFFCGLIYSSEIPDDSQNKIWLPLNWIIHENAVVGSVVQDSSFFLGIECKSSEEPAHIEDSSQDVMHSGYNNSLVMIKKFRVLYPCQMNITSFPFDQQNCKFVLTMDTRSNVSVILTSLYSL